MDKKQAQVLLKLLERSEQDLKAGQMRDHDIVFRALVKKLAKI